MSLSTLRGTLDMDRWISFLFFHLKTLFVLTSKPQLCILTLKPYFFLSSEHSSHS